MGTALPPNQPGTNCSLCFGVDRLLGLVTPKFIIVNFSGVQPGVGFEDGNIIPHGDFRLEQRSDCLWSLVVSGEFGVTAGFAPTRTRVSFGQTGATAVQWLGDLGATCQTFMANPITTPVGAILRGGQIRITWSNDGL